MSTQRQTIPVARLTCPGCDCGACVTEAVARIGALDGVVYVGIDRLRPGFVVRFSDDDVDLESIRGIIEGAQLDVAPAAAAAE